MVLPQLDSAASEDGTARGSTAIQSDTAAGDGGARRQFSRPQPDGADGSGGMARRIIRPRTPAAARNPSPRYAPQQLQTPPRRLTSGSSQPDELGRLNGQPGAQAQGQMPRSQAPGVHAPQRVTVSTAAQPDVLERIDRESDAVWRMQRRAVTSQRSQTMQLPWQQAVTTAAGTSHGSNPGDSKQQQWQQQQGQSASANGSVGAEDLSRLKVLELRQLCRERGLPQYGRKDELMQRLLSRR